MSALDEGLTDLCAELRFNGQVARGEIEVDQREPGVYSVGADGVEEFWGATEDVTAEMLDALAEAVIEADSDDYADYDTDDD